jgi:hypothetical protein
VAIEVPPESRHLGSSRRCYHAPAVWAVARSLLHPEHLGESHDRQCLLRQALLEFRQIYNSTWLIERHGFRTPDAVRQDQLSRAALAA